MALGEPNKSPAARLAGLCLVAFFANSNHARAETGYPNAAIEQQPGVPSSGLQYKALIYLSFDDGPYTEFATGILKKDKTVTTKDILASGRKKGLKVTPNQVSAVRKTVGISTGKGRKAGSRRAGRKTTRASAGNVDSYLQDAVVEAIRSAQYQKARSILGVLEES